MTSPTLGIVYHSQSGANEAIAKAAYRGAVKAAVKMVVQRACDASNKSLLTCDGVIFCFAEMNGTIAGGMKECLDRIYYPLTAQQKILPTAVYMSVGNGGAGAITQFESIATGLKLKPVSEPMIIFGEPAASQLGIIAAQAHGFAEGLTMGIF